MYCLSFKRACTTLAHCVLQVTHDTNTPHASLFNVTMLPVAVLRFPCPPHCCWLLVVVVVTRFEAWMQQPMGKVHDTCLETHSAPPKCLQMHNPLVIEMRPSTPAVKSQNNTFAHLTHDASTNPPAPCQTPPHLTPHSTTPLTSQYHTSHLTVPHLTSHLTAPHLTPHTAHHCTTVHNVVQ